MKNEAAERNRNKIVILIKLTEKEIVGLCVCSVAHFLVIFMVSFSHFSAFDLTFTTPH